MNWNFIDGGIDAIVIDNFFTNEQLELIFKELQELTTPDNMKSEADLSSANVDGQFLTSKSGLFLEEYYSKTDYSYSALMRHMKEQMLSAEVKDRLIQENPLYKSLYACNVRSHLLSYYENNDFYKVHNDSFFFTILTYFHKTPKQFEGGELICYSMDETQKVTIEPRNNRTVIIASCTPHEVTPIKMNPADNFSGNGRWCFTTFFTHRDYREINHDTN